MSNLSALEFYPTLHAFTESAWQSITSTSPLMQYDGCEQLRCMRVGAIAVIDDNDSALRQQLAEELTLLNDIAVNIYLQFDPAS